MRRSDTIFAQAIISSTHTYTGAGLQYRQEYAMCWTHPDTRTHICSYTFIFICKYTPKHTHMHAHILTLTSKIVRSSTKLSEMFSVSVRACARQTPVTCPRWHPIGQICCIVRHVYQRHVGHLFLCTRYIQCRTKIRIICTDTHTSIRIYAYT